MVAAGQDVLALEVMCCLTLGTAEASGVPGAAAGLGNRSECLGRREQDSAPTSQLLTELEGAACSLCPPSPGQRNWASSPTKSRAGLSPELGGGLEPPVNAPGSAWGGMGCRMLWSHLTSPLKVGACG